MKSTAKGSISTVARGLSRRRWLQAALAQTLLIADRVRAVTMRRSSDAVPPTVSLASPAAGTTVSGIVPIVANASDNLGLRQVQVSVNSTLVATWYSAPYQVSWDSTSVADGAVVVTASAMDYAGQSTSATATVTVSNRPATSTRRRDNAPPSVSITAPLAGSTVAGSVSVAVTAKDNVGVSRVELRVNSTLVGTLFTAPYTFSWNSTTVANGGAILVASAFDAAGNTASATTNVTVQNAVIDKTPPVVSITAPTDGSVVSGTVPVVVAASDNDAVARVELRVDSTLVGTLTVAPYQFSWDSTAAANGQRTLTASAFDRTGNQASASSGVTVQNGMTGPGWYEALPINAWSRLPVTSVSQEVCSNTNPSGIVWPSTSVAEAYDPTKPLVAGKHPIPGVSVFTYMAFSGGRMIENLSFVRNGVTYQGNYWVRYGGGHEGSPDNSLHAIGPFDGTPKRINLTDPSLPPAIDLVSDGVPNATWAPDGRPGAAEAYNSFAYIRSTNTLVVGQGAGYKEAAIALYAYRFNEDGGTNYPVDANGTYLTPPTGWVRNTNYWPTVTFPGRNPVPVANAGINLTQECAWMTDNARGEVWVIPTVTSTPYAYKASVAQASTFAAVEVTGLDGAGSGSFFKKGWAIEGEPWLVFLREHVPNVWWVINRDARNAFNRLQVYPVTFTGDPLPVSTITASSSQPTAGAAFDYEARCFYVWFAGNDTSVVLRDVYKIVPPDTALDSTPWTVTRITPSGGLTPEPPWGGIHYRVKTGATNVGGWSSYGNFEFVPSPTRGIFYHHRLDVPPLFWRLP